MFMVKCERKIGGMWKSGLEWESTEIGIEYMRGAIRGNEREAYVGKRGSYVAR